MISAMEVTSGRYISDQNASAYLGQELKLLSVKKAYLMGGKRALEAALPKLEPSLKEEGIPYQVAEFSGYCTYESAQYHAEKMKTEGCDCIVAIGGGRCIDTAKAAAEMVSCPLGTIPTQVATCVSCTNMAIMYEVSGKYIGPMYPKRPIAFTLADYEILSKAPIRYIASGIADSMAKYPELRFSQRGTPDCASVDDAALQASYGMSISTWDILMTNGWQAYQDNKNGQVSNPLTAVINTNLVTTGVISGLARGSKQLAMAHAVYNNSTTVFPEAWRNYLHGEIVSVGILLQEYYNNAPEEEIAAYVKLAKSMNVPVCLKDIGVEGTAAELDALHKALMKKFSDFSPEESKRMRETLERIKFL